MRIVMIASEAAPYCRVGSTSAVLEALPRALAERGHRVSLVVPLHRGMAPRFEGVGEVDPIGVRLHDGREEARLLRAREEPPGVEVFAIGADRYFDRPGVYGEGGVEYADSVRRFAFFCRAALGAIDALAIVPDVIHCHGWATALIPVYLRGGMLGADPAAVAREALGQAAVLITVHDLADQGVFPSSDFAAAGVSRGVVAPSSIESQGTINLLREGLVFADAITTPSPRNARDVRTPEHGAGLEDVLEQKAGAVAGILNGIDTNVWGPDVDAHLVTPFTPSDVHGKRRCKADLLVEMDLNAELGSPVAAVVSSLAPGNGFDILLPALPALLERGLRVAVLGEGDPRLASALRGLEDASARALAFREGVDESLEHKILAGADFLLMPHSYEACGVHQMRAQRYGTVPIVRAVGGLVDTVLDARAVPDRGTGFWIEDHTPEALGDAVDRGLAAFATPDQWGPLQVRAMRRDFSWRHTAARYVQLYRRLAQRPAERGVSVILERGGRHGRVADDFTLESVRAVAQGLAEYLFEEDAASALAQRGVLVAHDTRFLGAEFSSAAAGVLAWNDVSVVWSDEPVSLPAAACAVAAGGLAGALVVSGETADARWNGLHLMGPSGDPAGRETTAIVSARSAQWVGRSLEPQELGPREAVELGLRHTLNPGAVHRDVIESVVDVDAVRASGLRVACDLQWGGARGTLDRLLREWGVGGDVLNDAADPTFGGGRPEPTPARLEPLAQRVAFGHDLGVAVDASATRLGVVDRGGKVLAADHVLALLLDHLAETRSTGRRSVARSIATSRLIDAMAARRGLEVVETPTGFQELAALLGSGDAFFAVDATALASSESVPHPDAVLAALLVVEMVAYRRRSLDSQLEEVFRETGRLVSVRRRVSIARGQSEEVVYRVAAPPERLAGAVVESVVSLDGARLQLSGGGWLFARVDSEGPVLELAAEADTPGAVAGLVDAAQEFFVPGG